MTDSFDSDKEKAKVTANDTSISATQATKEQSSVGGRLSDRTIAREAFFQDFAQRARSSVEAANSKMVLIVTGGLRTRKGMADAIQRGKVDSVGIGRPACLYPDLPLIILNRDIPDEDDQSSPAKYKVKGGSVAALLPLQLAAPGWGT
jgi:2,4-dienoyl-CoA reductase-like NADH-dependent reductase (Old Yellow Enzyme family)